MHNKLAYTKILQNFDFASIKLKFRHFISLFLKIK